MSRRRTRIPKFFACLGLVAIAAWGIGSWAPAAERPKKTSGEDKAAGYVRAFNTQALRRAISDLTETFGRKYPQGKEYLARLTTLEQERIAVLAALDDRRRDSATGLVQLAGALGKLKYEALLANPLLDFDRLLLVKRAYDNPALKLPKNRRRNGRYGGTLGLPVNHYSTFSLPQNGYENEIAVLSGIGPWGKLTTLFKPRDDRFIGDVELHFDADRMLFSMPSQRRWQVFEIGTDGTGLRQVTPDDQPDVDNYDACYLPGGKIVFCSTANYQSVPCWNGLQNTAGLYVTDAAGKNVRQLTFDQDDDCCPAVLNTGQLLFNRWEYTNTPHVFAHNLFQMNPDGTNQANFYGSNSYWPNAVYFARAIPGHPTKVVGIVSGHHGDNRMGELVIFDPAKGRHDTAGVVQRIPGYGKKVEPIIRDALVTGSWPKFLHPYPLSENYFLVSSKPTPESDWGIYLVDVFDNMLLLRQRQGYALLEPIPLKKTSTPPVIAERIDRARKDGVVYLQDVYIGPGLAGVPYGSVKALRVYSYYFGYRGVTGWSKVGIDGPWDVMRILGTVPLQPDGSALFRVPANTPIGVEPLDEDGRALQVMRSWFTVMPGEVRSCVGCHEHPNTAPPGYANVTANRTPVDVEPWYGPPRGFDFEREVQPVLDKYCVGCHNGTPGPDGRKIVDLRATEYQPDYQGRLVNVPAWWSDENPDYWDAELMRSQKRKKIIIYFTPAYEALHPLVRRPGLESDYHLSVPAEYHANTSELVQMLQKGHYDVRLDKQAWDRLVTWIDLNVPCHGTWGEILPIPFDGVRRRRELLKLYANMDVDLEAVAQSPGAPVEPVMPEPLERIEQHVDCPGWPFDSEEAGRRQRAAGPATERTVDLGGDATMKLVLIPPGQLIMGDPEGEADEQPPARVRIDKPFWIGACEVTNRQYRRFDSSHDSRYINELGTNVETRGYPVNLPEQPVVRVSWKQATAFCRWLSEKTGEKFTLPSEAQWEYACRAGTDTALWYGDVGDDFAPHGNMADGTLARFALDRRARGPLYETHPDWMPRIGSVDDGSQVTSPVGSYRGNAWGLFDMHGNAAEWTRTTYKPYPYASEDGRNDVAGAGRRVVRGGSWYDRPKRCRSAFRLSYPGWQRVYNVGFRVICTTPVAKDTVAAAEK